MNIFRMSFKMKMRINCCFYWSFGSTNFIISVWYGCIQCYFKVYDEYRWSYFQKQFIILINGFALVERYKFSISSDVFIQYYILVGTADLDANFFFHKVFHYSYFKSDDTFSYIYLLYLLFFSLFLFLNIFLFLFLSLDKTLD